MNTMLVMPVALSAATDVPSCPGSRRYALTCCSWFAKDFPRLMAAKAAHHWDPYDVEELRGKTLGVVGLGCAAQGPSLLKLYNVQLACSPGVTALAAQHSAVAC
jgi:hypothetical protein